MLPAFSKKHTLEQTAFAFTSDGFKHSGLSFKFSDVVETLAIRVIHQTRHVPIGVTTNHDAGIGIRISMRAGDVVQLLEQSTLFSSSENEKVEKIQEIFDVICAHTFDNRLRFYTDQLASTGYFEYSGWRFYPAQNKVTNIDSKQTYSLPTVTLWKNYGFIELKHVGKRTLAQQAVDLYRGPISINTLPNTDVFFALLKHYFNISWN